MCCYCVEADGHGCRIVFLEGLKKSIKVRIARLRSQGLKNTKEDLWPHKLDVLFSNVAEPKEQIGLNGDGSDFLPGRAWFDSRPGPWLLLLNLLWVFLVPSGRCWDSTLKYATTASFQILSYSLANHSTLHSLSYWPLRNWGYRTGRDVINKNANILIWFWVCLFA
jgi:hypothetical protein